VRIVALLFAVAAASILAACGTLTPTPTELPPRLLGPDEAWAPTVDTQNGHALCAGGGATAVIRLHGSPQDPRLTWETLPDGTEVPVVWPRWTSLRFAPDLQVFGPDGALVAREGSQVTGGCRMPNGELPEFGGEVPS
jgi:hypothetical protein